MMNEHNVAMAAAIREWFSLKKGCGIILPDGWFGRPHDNFHPLTYLELRPHKLLIELSSQLFLVLTEPSCRIGNSSINFTDFRLCIFDWQEFVSFRSHAKAYGEGNVELVDVGRPKECSLNTEFFTWKTDE